MRADVANLESLSAQANLPNTTNGSNHSGKLLALTPGELLAADPIRQHIEETHGWESFVPYHLEEMVMM